MTSPHTSLPPIDHAQVVEFWQRFLAGTASAGPSPSMPEAEPFGDSVELADELIALIVDGPKRATAGSFVGYERSSEPLPVVGGFSIATDGSGRPRAVLRTTDVRVGPLSSVDDAFAWDEGEGDRSRASWLADHEAFFRRYLATIDVAFDDDMPTVFERFEVLYVE